MIATASPGGEVQGQRGVFFVLFFPQRLVWWFLYSLEKTNLKTEMTASSGGEVQGQRGVFLFPPPPPSVLFGGFYSGAGLSRLVGVLFTLLKKQIWKQR